MLQIQWAEFEKLADDAKLDYCDKYYTKHGRLPKKFWQWLLNFAKEANKRLTITKNELKSL